MVWVSNVKWCYALSLSFFFFLAAFPSALRVMWFKYNVNRTSATSGWKQDHCWVFTEVSVQKDFKCLKADEWVVVFFPGKGQMELIQENGAKLYDLLSPFLVFSTTSNTMAGMRHIGVMTRAKTTLGGGSLSVSVGHSWKKEEWISTNMSSTSLLGHGSIRHSAMSSEHMVNLL